MSFDAKALAESEAHEDRLMNVRPVTRGRSQEFAAGATRPPRIVRTEKGSESDQVHMTDVTGMHDDQALANHAGFSDRHHGFNVKRYPDSTDATVSLWKS
jgi:hypothetical protein